MKKETIFTYFSEYAHKINGFFLFRFNSSMDFIKQIHEDLYDLILQHLTVSELLNVSKVSRYWYEVIGNTSVFSSKIWVNVDDRYAEPCKGVVKIFQNSPRKYVNFKIFEVGNGLEIIHNNKQKWKQAQISIQSFIEKIQYYQLLKIIQPHIINLEIFEMDVQESHKIESIEISTFSFPKLYKLYFGFMPITAIEPFIESCPYLNTIVFDEVNFKEIQHEEQTIFNFFKSLHCLKNLQIPVILLNIIIKDCKNINFSLQKLFIHFSNEEMLHEIQLENFLSKQENINWVKLYDCSQSIIVTFLKTCKHLKKLSIEYFDHSSSKFDTLSLLSTKNYSVEKIDLECENLTLEWIVPILKSMIGLQNIYVFHLTEELLNYIVENNINIRKLFYCSIYKSFTNSPKFDKVQLIENKCYLEDCKL